MAEKLHQIGEVAERTGLSLRTIRYYEELDLVVPSGRTTGGFRLYTDDDIQRLELVKRLKVLDLPLEETREALDALDALETSAVGGDERDRLHATLASFVAAAGERQVRLESRLQAAREAIHQVRSQVRRDRRAPSSSRR